MRVFVRSSKNWPSVAPGRREEPYPLDGGDAGLTAGVAAAVIGVGETGGAAFAAGDRGLLGQSATSARSRSVSLASQPY